MGKRKRPCGDSQKVKTQTIVSGFDKCVSRVVPYIVTLTMSLMPLGSVFEDAAMHKTVRTIRFKTYQAKQRGISKIAKSLVDGIPRDEWKDVLIVWGAGKTKGHATVPNRGLLMSICSRLSVRDIYSVGTSNICIY